MRNAEVIEHGEDSQDSSDLSLLGKFEATRLNTLKNWTRN
jgi:hypothetical protein